MSCNLGFGLCLGGNSDILTMIPDPDLINPDSGARVMAGRRATIPKYHRSGRGVRPQSTIRLSGPGRTSCKPDQTGNVDERVARQHGGRQPLSSQARLVSQAWRGKSHLRTGSKFHDRIFQTLSFSQVFEDIADFKGRLLAVERGKRKRQAHKSNPSSVRPPQEFGRNRMPRSRWPNVATETIARDE